MGSVDPTDQPWPPYGNLKDCSLGFCSIYCPQWCYFVFPPPPPSGDLAGADSSTSSNNFSPLVIAIIGILASAFLLVCYYTVVSRYCNRAGRRRVAAGATARPPEELAGDVWRIATRGLDDAVIKSIAIFKYRRGEAFLDATDCSVCLSEFTEEEKLRLLPKCGHAFHIPCIDTWLKSHSNCPLCRANILPSPSPAPATATAATPPPPQPLPPPLPAAPVPPATGHGRALSNLEVELREEVVQPMRRSVSMDSICQGRVLIADVLRIDFEEELERRDEERRKKVMKRSASSSSGRFDLFGAGRCCRGRSSALLPL